MSIQATVNVPRELLERLTALPVGSWEQRRSVWDAISEITDLLSAPVPPAGDVEVLEVYGYQCRQSAQEKFFLHEYPHYWQHIPLVRQADAMERITRLTAERDGQLADLKAMGERYQKDLMLSRERWCYGNRADTKIAELQSELTKARELINDLQAAAVKRTEWSHEAVARIDSLEDLLNTLLDEEEGIPAAQEVSTGFAWHALHRSQNLIRDSLAQPTTTTTTTNADEGCGQDAEAAKGEPEPTCNEQRSEIGLPTNAECVHCGRGRCFDR